MYIRVEYIIYRILFEHFLNPFSDDSTEQVSIRQKKILALAVIHA